MISPAAVNGIVVVNLNNSVNHQIIVPSPTKEKQPSFIYESTLLENDEYSSASLLKI